MAKAEFDAWTAYQAQRKEDTAVKKTPDEILEEEFQDTRTHFDHTIKPHELKLLKEFFDRFKVSRPSSLTP